MSTLHIGEVLCPGMAYAETGHFRCDPHIEEWFVDEWNDGNACVPKCEEFGSIYGPGCCEARPREGAYCRFGKNLVKGLPDSKAINCIGTSSKQFKFLFSAVKMMNVINLNTN